MYVVDALQNQIEAFSLTGTPLFRIGARARAPARAAIAPRSLAFGPRATCG